MNNEQNNMNQENKNCNIELNINIKPMYNYVNYQCDVYYKNKNNSTKQSPYSLIESIVIDNKDNIDYKDLRLSFKFSHSLINVLDIYLSDVVKNTSTKVTEGIMTEVNALSLYNVSESVPVNLLVYLYDKNDNILKQVTKDIIISPMNEVSEIASIPELLACFVTPNAIEIEEVIKLGIQNLSEMRKVQSDFIGYQANDIDSVREEMMAIYNALRSLKINYANPPASFNRFQSARLPSEVINKKLGTCLDLSILYCACLEAIGLNPILIMIDGHAFAGCFLNDECFVERVCTDVGKIFNKSATDNLSIELVECTLFTAANCGSFNDANIMARDKIRFYSGGFEAIDILSCHKSIFRPIPTKKLNGNNEWEVKAEIAIMNEELRRKNSEDNEVVFEGIENSDKFNYWSKKLLDLSLKNKLINFKLGPSAPQLIYNNAISILEKLLHTDFIYLYPNDTVLEKDKYYEYKEDQSSIDKLAKTNVYGIVTNDKNLKALFRSGASSIEETGSNNLYLSFGLLNFIPKYSKKALIAPIFLIPVRGKSKRGPKGYELLIDYDNVSINTTVFEYLKQNCDISFDELYDVDKELNGLKISSIFNAIREKTSTECTIAVDDNKVFLSTYSFANYIIWEDIHNRKDQLLENKIIKSFVDGVPYTEEEGLNTDNVNLDDILEPQDIAIPLSADSSQIKAIVDCASGKSFVLDGPPGTGKSQTIVNMIVNSMYNGKSVLFVAEKMAALEVVKKRIDDINLGYFCLEIHSNKANKKNVLDQISKALEHDHTASPRGFDKSLDDLKAKRDSLNDFVKRIHTSNGLYSLADLIAKYCQVEEYNVNIRDEKKLYLKINQESLKQIHEVFSNIMLIASTYKEYSELSHYAFDIDNYNTFAMKDDLKYKLISLKDSIGDLVNRLNSFKNLFESKIDFSVCNTKLIIDMLSIVLSSKIVFNTLYTDDIYKNNELSLDILEKGILNNELSNEFGKLYNMDLLHENVNILYNDLKEAKYLRKIFINIKIKKLLKKYLLDKKTKLNSKDYLDLLEDIIKYQNNKNYIDNNDGYLKKLFKDEYDADNYSLMKEKYHNTYDFKKLLDELKFASNSKDQIIDVIHSFKNIYKINIESDADSYKFNKLIEVFKKYTDDKKEVVLNYKLNTSKFNFKDQDDAYDLYLEIVYKMIENMDDIEGVSLYNSCFNKLIKLNVTYDLIDKFIKGMLKSSDIIKNYDAYLFYFLIGEYFKDKYYFEFNGLMFDEGIKKYNELLEEYTQLIITETASKITKDYPINDFEYAKSTMIYGLKKCIKNGGQKTTIRNILKEFGVLIRKICPCFLMSPMSAAQYLSLDSEKFDVVIFDEASQILTAEAIGAISRGDSLVVAGDPEQMPPTTFFKSMIGNDDIVDASENFDDLESLLDDCLALGMKQNRLLWHYRSNHESLIAFSNNTFYDRTLYTFPSPDNSFRKLKFNYVEDGVYDHGINKKEVDAVVNEVIRRFEDPVLSKQSIGIVTFNTKQQELILDRISELFETNQKYFEINENNKDKLFVKNLENVQGDERDVVIFSIGFGYNDKKKFSLLFGPLSLEKGERRLNVAITRARNEMIVFSSIHSSDINAEKAKNRGAEILKEFLMYAEMGMSSLVVENRRQDLCDLGIEEDVQKELKKRGIDADVLVGDSKFKINLCIKNETGKYILAVLIDGGIRSKESTCRDRNCVQIKALQRLNWNVINIYSIDYIKNKNKVIDNIIEASKKQNVIIEDTKEEFDINFEKENIKAYKRSRKYVQYKVSKKMDYNSMSEFYVYYDVLNELKNVIDNEGPISYNLLLEKFKDIVGVSKAGAKVKRIFDMTLKQIDRVSDDDINQKIYYPVNVLKESIDYYRKSTQEDRDILDIPTCEIKQAMLDIIELQGEIKESDMAYILGDFFGMKAITQTTLDKLNKSIKYVIKTSNLFVVKNNFISIK